VVTPPAGRGAALLLARAATPEQAARAGDQTGGRVALFPHTDDFRAGYRPMQARGVRFAGAPREERYGTAVVFYDRHACRLYGHRRDLAQPKAA
jgi:hypothetical protein